MTRVQFTWERRPSQASAEALRGVVRGALESLGVERGEVHVLVSGDARLEELNTTYRGVTEATDVLSFPMDDEPTPGVPTLLVDVVISPAVAAQQFADHAGTLDDELALLVVHGVLHVLGHDHAEPEETASMRRRELELLEAHHWSGPAPSGFRQTHD